MQAIRKRNAIVFLMLTVFLDSIGIGILIPIIPELIEHLTQTSVSQAAVYGGLITAVFATMQFIASPVLGSLSDSYGRRLVLLISLTAFGLNYLLMAFAPSLTWLFVAQALAGLFGATQSAAAAYITDVTEPKDRAGPFGWLGAAFGLGFMVGPVLSGLMSDFGLKAPFFVAAGLTLINVTYGYFVLPESLPKDKRKTFQFKQSNPIKIFAGVRRFQYVPSLLVATFLLQIGLQAVTVTWPYFTSFQFDWSPKDIGLSLGVYGIVNVITQGLILGRLSRAFGNVTTTIIGFVLLTIGLIGFSVTTAPTLAYLFIIPHAMAFMTQGAIRSLISTQVPANEQGAVQGAVISVNSLVAIITPLTMPTLFSVFSSGQLGFVFAGAPYLVASVIAVSALLIVVPIKGKLR